MPCDATVLAHLRFKIEFARTKLRVRDLAVWDLAFAVLLLFGIWCLEFGHFFNSSGVGTSDFS
jgi:hypothetical protein